MKSIKELSGIKGKRILLRVDFNVPMNNGKVEDDQPAGDDERQRDEVDGDLRHQLVDEADPEVDQDRVGEAGEHRGHGTEQKRGQHVRADARHVALNHERQHVQPRPDHRADAKKIG